MDGRPDAESSLSGQTGSAEKIVIRPYQVKDRDGVRQVCCDTGDKGEVVENFFMDREFFADVITKYYTDYESESLWIAEAGQKVVGYLTGCLDSRRFKKMAVGIVLQALIKALFRKKFWNRKTWNALRALVKTGLKGGFRQGPTLEKYPAHLHINVMQAYRQQKVGPALIEHFMAQVKEFALEGIHLVTRGDNQSACRFFEKMGFRALFSAPVVLPEGTHFKETRKVIYGKNFLP